MLGISTPDAIALGTLMIAVLAAWKGDKSGAAAKAATPVEPSRPSTIADIELLTNALSANTAAAIKLAAVLEEEADRHKVEEEVREAVERREMQLMLEQHRSHAPPARPS